MFEFYVLRGYPLKELVNSDFTERILLHHAMEQYNEAFKEK